MIELSQEYSTIIEQIKEIPIETVFSRYLPGTSFKRAGNGKHRTRCFQHGGGNEKDASLFIYENTNSFYCFGCSCGGSVVDLVMLILNLDFSEAVKRLADDFGYELPVWTPETEEKRKQKEKVTNLLDKYINKAHITLMTNRPGPEAAREALHKRGFTDKDIKEFRFGFDPRNKPDNPEEAQALGLIGDKGGFLPSGRIVIPFFHHGKPIYLAFWDFNGKEPKYLYPSGVVKPLVGIDGIKRAKEIFLVEGVFDHFTLIKEGFNSICTLGVNLKEDYYNNLNNLETIYVAYDADEAGRREGFRLTESLFPRAKLIEIPGNVKDINDLLKTQPGEFKTLIDEAKDNAKDALDIIFNDIAKTNNGNEALTLFEKKVIPLITKLDIIKQDIAVNKVSKLLKPYGIKKSSLDIFIKEMMAKNKNTNNDEEEKEDFQPCADFPGLVDIVEDDNGNPAFLVLEDDNTLTLCTSREVDGIIKIPPDKEAIPWLLPRAQEVIRYFKSDNDSILYDDLIKYHKNISELPDEKFYDLFVAWDFHTYIIEKLNYSPYIWLFARPERGKSRTGKGALYVARRGVHVESLRDSYIIRASNDLKVTLFFDVLDLMKKMEKTGTDDVFLMRYERGAKVPRVNFPDRGALRDTVYYEVFGPSIIATNRTIYGPMESRALQLNMQPAIKNFTNEVTPEAALSLKERLTAFRARWLNKKLPEVDKPMRGRLGDITRPLFQIIKAIKPEREKIFRDLINEINKERKSKKSESVDATILKVIDEISNKIEGSYVYVDTITKQINNILNDEKKWSNTRTGIV
ncbi:MAG: DNA primase [Pelotomaculum sp. PtaB.Bin013]|uniref:CHC2 zinc finger domain-containing protein n=1 Tax=Pelotomaculum isophthalicicum JI TaxID=947010 RepID=A0A9X4JUN0_9FIRM|nr:CHC2 zinc finger domain-containing protein [Pelotomaculum isophthalicicum]MDF9409550.1 CHC2 zinc finger domain-containing protein [Pelotomaculum isophthalicicum JI]OPX83711.1 MAG: DNA primase [Pelotomaculum sp. PtaB.Bin013]